MARRVVDLDPADYTARIELRARFRLLREQAGLSQREFGKLTGQQQGTVSKFERTGVDQAMTSTIARWARWLDHRLTLTPVGFPRPVRWRRQSDRGADLLAALVTTHNVAAFGGADGWMAASTLYDLVGIRVACGVSQERLAQVLGISEQSISLTERGFADNQLATLQKYARALARASRHRGGHLTIGLDPIDQPQHDTSV